AYQTVDLVEAMAADAGHSVESLRVDGGASANNFLMQFQADLLNTPVVRPQNTETTALGAAMLAGLTVNFWDGPDALAHLNPPEQTFVPTMSEDQRQTLLEAWHRAVQTTRAHGNTQ
ncbi:MAG: FGGY-family carbohydrate kinase, partial [bacterium]|nr:FGGY-family carbohydrate kinase [bacterium]